MNGIFRKQSYVIMMYHCDFVKVEQFLQVLNIYRCVEGTDMKINLRSQKHFGLQRSNQFSFAGKAIN